MLFRNIFAFITISLFEIILLQEEVMVEIDGIEPNAGPLYGETRVLVRLKNLNEKYVLKNGPGGNSMIHCTERVDKHIDKKNTKKKHRGREGIR